MIEQLKEEIKYLMGESGCHDWEHVIRVYNLAKHIGEKEGCDMEILELSAILHDVGRSEESRTKGELCHAQVGAVIAEGILQNYQISSEKIEKIKHCILTHRKRKGLEPESKEAKVLFDADKLDSLGAIGIGRLFFFACEHGAKVHNSPDVDIENTESYTKEDTAYREYYHNLKNLKDRFYTEEGKKIAKERLEFMKEFFERINSETRGEC
ncbi:HD domain-containing protein [archaeon]|nr:HD domain-containing protein [archaeon]